MLKFKLFTNTKNQDSKIFRLLKVPFIGDYPESVEKIILEYTHPDDLKQFCESNQANFQLQKNIQIPAGQMLINSYKSVLESLKYTVKKFYPEAIELDIQVYQTESEAYQDKYIELCKEVQFKLEAVLKKIDLETINADRNLVLDCVVHYSYNNSLNAGKLLYRLAQNTPENAYIIDLAIAQGANLDGHVLSRFTGFGFSLDIIQLLSSKASNHLGSRYTSNTTLFPATGVFYAAFHQDQAVLNFMVNKYPDTVNLAFVELNDVFREFLGISVSNHSIISPYTVSFYKADIKKATIKLLNASKNLLLDEKSVLNCLYWQLDDVDLPKEWKKIYDDFIHQNCLNQKLTKLSVFKYQYSSAKIQLIEKIRVKMYEYFIDINTVRQFSLQVYYKQCKEILESDIFSKKHEVYGVSAKYRELLLERVSEVNLEFSRSKNNKK